MKFSVVTVSYNHAEFIRDTIESVLAQSYPDFEHIIVDGGSTDGTLEILRQYPHLHWISEPDRGQSHALNKGFRMATGDVICWLNSDDWYAPGAFNEVALALRNSSIVIGASELARKDGTPYERRANVSRNWYDVLKNWVYHSSPDQPSVFFKRHILEEFALPNGDFIDENLHFAMDYDWWLRIGEKYPLQNYIPQTLSFIRVYDTAKTGAHMASVYREMSRVFRRHEARRIAVEQNITYVIPITRFTGNMHETLSSINGSSIPRIEVIIADSSPEAAVQRKNRSNLLDLESKYPRLILRHVGSSVGLSSTKWSAIHEALLASRSPVSVVVESDSTISPDQALRLLRVFEQDNVALVVPTLFGGDSVHASLLTAPQALKIPPVYSGFAIRNLAYRELAECLPDALAHLHLRTIAARSIHRAWLTLTSELVQVEQPTHDAQSHEAAFGLYTNAALLDEFYLETSRDSFTALRAKNGFALMVPDELWSLARQHLQQAPTDWRTLHEGLQEKELREIVSRCPHFGPARLLLAEALAKRGEIESSRHEREMYDQISKQEMSSPLYS